MQILNIRALREEAGLLNPLLSDLPLLVKVLGCDYNAVFVERPWEMEDEYEAC